MYVEALVGGLDEKIKADTARCCHHASLGPGSEYRAGSDSTRNIVDWLGHCCPSPGQSNENRNQLAA